jgi:hypothetical protein
MVFRFNSAPTVGRFVYLDGIKVERGKTPTSLNDPASRYLYTTKPIADGAMKQDSNLTPAALVPYVANGYEYSDVQVTVKATVTALGAGSVSNYALSPAIKWHAGDLRYLWATNEGASLVLYYYNGSTNVSVASAAITAPAVGDTRWLRLRSEGNVITAEWWAFPPTPNGTPATTVSFTLTASTNPQAVLMGQSRAGLVSPIGWQMISPGTADVTEFVVEPYTYTKRTFEELRLAGAIPGDAPALAELVVTNSGAAQIQQWAAFGWWPRLLGTNYVWNGDFEFAHTGGWTAAAVSNIANAASSVAAVLNTAAKYRTWVGEVVTPATSISGASFGLGRRFKKGVAYTAELWARAASSTTQMALRFGDSSSSDIVNSAGSFLTTAWQRYSVTWTPTADRETAYLALVTQAATATTYQMDGVMVYEGTSAPALWSQQEGRGAAPAIGIIEAEQRDPITCSANVATATADANARLGVALEWPVNAGAGSSFMFAEWLVDAAVATPDDYANGELAVEVWARMLMPTAGNAPLINVTLRLLDAGGSLSGVRYADEFGSVGRTIPAGALATWGLYRLGTLRFVSDRKQPTRWRLGVTVDATGTAGTLGLDYLMLFPASSRALLPTGKPSTNYPAFLPTTTEYTKRVAADLTGRVGAPSDRYLAPSHGLGGSLLELPPGDTDIMVRLSNHIPDGALANNNPGQDGGAPGLQTVHLALTPRWYLARPS